MFKPRGGTVAMIFTGIKLIREKLEKPKPYVKTRFDWEAYEADVKAGVSDYDRMQKRMKGGYDTTTPAPPKWWELPLDTVVDTARYEHDKKIYSPELLQRFREEGEYRQIKRFGSHEELFGKKLYQLLDNYMRGGDLHFPAVFSFCTFHCRM